MNQHANMRWISSGLIAVWMCGCATRHDPQVFHAHGEAWWFLGREGVRVTTDHFDFHTTIEDAELRGYVPEFLEATYQFYESILPEPERVSRMQTYLFASRREWDVFTKRNYPERYELYRKITAGGYSEGDTCVVYDIGRAQTLSVIAHEGWHQYLSNKASGAVPAWLNEGLATYCESIDIRKGRAYIVPHRNTFRINHLCNAFSRKDALSLRALLNTDAGRIVEGERSSVTTAYYAQVWALMVYLRHGEQGRHEPALRRLLNDIMDGSCGAKSRLARIASANPSQIGDGESVFRAYITDDLEAFEASFREFAYQLCWKR